MIEITLPWPDKRLSPNVQKHYHEKAKAKKTARAFGEYLTMEATDDPQFIADFVGVPDVLVAQYIFHPPDRRKRDIDNCLAMMKSYQDGVCWALEIDDIRIKRTVIEWGDVTPGGKVVLTLEELE